MIRLKQMRRQVWMGLALLVGNTLGMAWWSQNASAFNCTIGLPFGWTNCVYQGSPNVTCTGCGSCSTNLYQCDQGSVYVLQSDFPCGSCS
jgi:hypothetical protein